LWPDKSLFLVLVRRALDASCERAPATPLPGPQRTLARIGDTRDDRTGHPNK